MKDFKFPLYLARSAALVATSLTVTLTVTLSLSLSGCVTFGNHIVQATNPDPISGYYATAAQTLQFFSTVNGQDSSASAPVSQIPTSVSGVLTDPSWIQLQDLSTGAAQISSPGDATQYISVNFQSDNLTFGMTGSYPAVTLWNNSACTLQEFIEVSGRIQPPGDTPATMAYQGTSYPISGRLGMDIWIEQTISGNCSESLQEMSACYQDVTQCGGTSSQENQANQQYVQQLFSPYIQAGTLTAQEISNVSDVAFQISYQ